MKSKKKKYTFSFYGRQTGAIGILYQIQDTYEEQDLETAVRKLFHDYELSRNLKLNGKPFEIKDSMLENGFTYQRETARK